MGANKCKKNDLFAGVMGKTADDFVEFLVLEQVAKKREALESICQPYAVHGHVIASSKTNLIPE